MLQRRYQCVTVVVIEGHMPKAMDSGSGWVFLGLLISYDDNEERFSDIVIRDLIDQHSVFCCLCRINESWPRAATKATFRGYWSWPLTSWMAVCPERLCHNHQRLRLTVPSSLMPEPQSWAAATGGSSISPSLMRTALPVTRTSVTFPSCLSTSISSRLGRPISIP